MISSAIWITSDSARSFRLTPEDVIETNFKLAGPRHHGSEHGPHHADTQDNERLFSEISTKLIKGSDDRFLILGPGLAKTHFQKYLTSHYPKANIVGVETTDKLTDGEILDFAHRYFRKFDSLNS